MKWRQPLECGSSRYRWQTLQLCGKAWRLSFYWPIRITLLSERARNRLKEFVEVERLVNGRGADAARGLFQRLWRVGREEDHRRELRQFLLQLSDHLNAGHIRQSQIKQNQVGRGVRDLFRRLRRYRLYRAAARLDGLHAVTFILQNHSQ